MPLQLQPIQRIARGCFAGSRSIRHSSEHMLMPLVEQLARRLFAIVLVLGCALVATQSASAQWCHDGLGSACGDLEQRICVVDAWWNLSNCPSTCKAPYSLRWGVCRAACPGTEIAGVCCGDTGEIACITAPACAPGLSIADPTQYDPKFTLNCVPGPSPATTPLNGSVARPFYIWAHNPNSAGKIASDLAAGANALEPDITLAKDGPCPGTTDSTIADLVDEDSSSPYRTGLCSDTHFEDWLDYVKNKALDPASKLALIAFDIKSSAADAAHVKKILDAIRSRLTFYVPTLNVLLSVGSLADAKAAFGDGTETSWAGIVPPLTAKEGVMIDGEDDAQAVNNFFLNRFNPYSNFGYGDGTAVNAADVSFTGAQPRALDKGAFLRAKLGYPKVVSYAYLLNNQAEMHSFINGGVDGIIPGTITSVVPVPDVDCASYYQTAIDKLDRNSPNYSSDFLQNFKYKALCTASPNPDPDLDVSEIKNLVSVVSSHPEIRVATRDDNPLVPKLQSYGLEIATPSGGGNGTDANLQFTLTGCKGTAEITVNTGHIVPIIYDTGRMENGNTDYVTIPSADLGTLESIKIYNDGTGLGPDWTFKDLKVSSAGYIGADVNSTVEYQALGTTTLAAFDTVTLPLKANFSGGGTFSAPSLPDVFAQCSANLPSPAPTASQSCSTTAITGTTTSTGPFGQGDTSIVWTFTDAAKNSKTRTQAVHVHDTIAPVADAASLPNVIAQCSATLPAAPTATDNCSGKITGTTTAPNTFGQGDFTAMWTFTDAQGNRSAENQSILVHDTIAPVITCPAPIVVNAASPTGVAVPFSVTATDNCSVTSLTSVPASGSKFSIGTTTVNSQARDIALPTGNVSACSFTVHVKGAAEQLQDLLEAVTGVGPGKSLASKVQDALDSVATGNTAGACSVLRDFMSEVQAQSGKKLTNAQANSFLTDAARIRAVLGC